MGDLKRATIYRERGDALGRAAKSLPPAEQAAALRQQNGLYQLADMEEWVSQPPLAANVKFDLGLSRTSEPNDTLSKLIGGPGKARGRRAQPVPSAAATVKIVDPPMCPDCDFAMTPLCREKANVRLPNVRLFECRPCGIITTSGSSS